MALQTEQEPRCGGRRDGDGDGDDQAGRCSGNMENNNSDPGYHAASLTRGLLAQKLLRESADPYSPSSLLKIHWLA